MLIDNLIVVMAQISMKATEDGEENWLQIRLQARRKMNENR